MAVSKATKAANPGMKGRQSARSLRNRSRKNAKKLKGIANQRMYCATGLARSLSSLDKQAKELGIYDEGFHCMSRKERKHLVSKALSEQRNAA